MMLLDEKAHRRPWWDESAVHRIQLADGQLWAFPRPVAAGGARDHRGYAASLVRVAAPILADLRRRLDEGETVAPFRIGVHLLGLTYDLPDRAYRVLLRWHPNIDDQPRTFAEEHADEEPDYAAAWEEIQQVATGQTGPPYRPGDRFRSLDLWRRAARLLVAGPSGSPLLEEVNAAVSLAVSAGEILEPSKWVPGLIYEAQNKKSRDLMDDQP